MYYHKAPLKQGGRVNAMRGRLPAEANDSDFPARS